MADSPFFSSPPSPSIADTLNRLPAIVSVNGTVTAPEAAHVPALDRGVLYGDSVFETLVAFDDTPLDMTRHFARLRRSAAELAFEIPWSDAELAFELSTLCAMVDGTKKSIRLVVTRGDGMGLVIPPNTRPNRVIYVDAAPAQPAALYRDGIALKVRRLPFTERGFSPKTPNYARSIVALREARRDGFDDVLWTNSEGEFTESTTSNIFFIGRQGDAVEIATPAVLSGLLPGITRALLLELLEEARIAASEKVLFTEELPRFDEAFVCSTVRGLVPVHRVDSHRLHTARDNSVYRQIERLFMARLTRELGRAVDWNTGVTRRSPPAGDRP